MALSLESKDRDNLRRNPFKALGDLSRLETTVLDCSVDWRTGFGFEIGLPATGISRAFSATGNGFCTRGISQIMPNFVGLGAKQFDELTELICRCYTSIRADCTNWCSDVVMSDGFFRTCKSEEDVASKKVNISSLSDSSQV